MPQPAPQSSSSAKPNASGGYGEPVLSEVEPHTLRALPILPRSFYDRPVVQVAVDLLGKWLLRQLENGILLAGRIVEVEAYLPQHDPANHAYRGRTRRNASMFGPPGNAYVYAIHSRHCLNVVTEPEGIPSAVLIRALAPFCGMETMQKLRGTNQLRELARGPGKLCQALAIDRRLDGHDLTRGELLWLAEDAHAVDRQGIFVSPRIGVTSAQDLPLRFYLADSPFVSGQRHGTPLTDLPSLA
ncbi:MAG: DNA-3-methyladenine glycosylase [Gemmatales bacterium]|nr:DNA-3-methyladenine glycosylase [Gemmatales bacterium]MDW7994654.1 DNA-3-methyladenine glycosylase [Gemmatales bacterium]